MLRATITGGLLLAGGLCPSQGEAQALRLRSQDYLTVAGADDVRAAWVNPGGLARVLEASVMAEAVVDRLPEVRLSQYTLGLNSRGFSLAHARDRTNDSTTVSLTRLALGMSLGRTAVGVGVTLFRGAGQGEGVDLGLVHHLVGAVDVAAALRNLSRPQARGAAEPVLAVAGARWGLIPGVLSIETEAAAADAGSGFGNLRYGAMLRVTAPGQTPIHALTGVRVDGRTVERLYAGLGIGSPGWFGIVGGSSRSEGLGNPDRFSLTGVASHRARVRR